jgi:lysophospholipase L1-like esterase
MKRFDPLGTRPPFRLTLALLPCLLGCAAVGEEHADPPLGLALVGQGVDAATPAARGSDASASAADAVSSVGDPARPPTSPWRIVALGDSTTETSCTTQLLWKNLRDAGRTDFDLVGTRKNVQGCGVNDADTDTEGHSGYLVTDLLPGRPHASELPQWANANRADIALVHFATNDVWNGRAPAQILEAYTAVIGALRAAQPSVITFVAQIIPLRPQGCADCPSRTAALNREIPAWAARTSTKQSPIYVVDQARGFDPVSDTHDGVHPNQRGAQKMADAWAAALISRQLP